MKAIRKPLIDEVWRNLAPDEEGYEPMPAWVTAEVGAEPGKTFMIHSPPGLQAPRVCRPGWWVVKGPTDIYPVSPEGFEASYESP